jgi:large subunit ribosomal protein L10e
MALRPGRCYTKHERPYTRISTRKPKKSYVKGVPAIRIHQFEVGAKGDYPLKFHLISNRNVQIRSNALEAARTIATNFLTKKIGDRAFFLKIRVYPHQVLRENAMATGAGADRFSQGMRKSFGKPIGQAARIKKGQKIISVHAPENSEKFVKIALKRSSSKLPGTYKIVAGD